MFNIARVMFLRFSICAGAAGRTSQSEQNKSFSEQVLPNAASPGCVIINWKKKPRFSVNFAGEVCL